MNQPLRRATLRDDVTGAENKTTDHEVSERHPLMSETDINNILVNGAMISLAKLKRAQSFNARIYYYAEIGVYLEVSLSRGAGITDATLEALERIHQEATRIHMDASKMTRQSGVDV